MSRIALFGFLFLLSPFPSAIRAQSAEAIEVRVVDVDVVVTDRSGNPVRGLTAADFEIYENGKKQAITHFSEVNEPHTPDPTLVTKSAPGPTDATAGATEREPRKIVIFIDQLQLPRHFADSVFASLQRFLRESVGPSDRVMLATWDGRLNVPVDFTADLAAVEAQLLRRFVKSLLRQDVKELVDLDRQLAVIRDDAAFAAGASIPFEFDSEAAETFARRSNASSLRSLMKRKIGSLSSLLDRVGPLDGKKIFLLVSQDFYFDTLDTSSDGIGPGAGIAGEYSMYSKLVGLAKLANAYDITFHAFHPQGVDGSALAASIGSPQLLNRMGRPYSALMNQTRSLDLVSDRTGGTLAVGPTGISRAFNRVTRELSSYYSLAWRPTSQRKERKIEVRTKNRSLRVRNRTLHVEQSAEERIRAKVAANFFYPVQSRFPIAVFAGAERAMKKSRTVDIEVRVPFVSLTLVPGKDGMVEGGVRIFLAARNEAGDFSGVSEQRYDVRVPESSVGGSRNKHVAYVFSLEIGKSSQEISVAVVDQLSQNAAFARVTVPRSGAESGSDS
jgi:VWFA-related protein